MDAQQHREQFAAELRRHRLPRAYIERLLAEWDDHLADLQDERNRQMNTARNQPSPTGIGQGEGAATTEIINLQSRLGDPAQLAASAARQYHNRSFLGRHPILTFLILPYPIALLFLVFMCLLLTGFSMAMNAWMGDAAGNSAARYPLAENTCCVCMAWAFIVLPPFCTTLILCRIARRNTIDWRWAIGACAMVALFAGQFRFGWRLATLPRTGMIMFGLGFNPQSAMWILGDFLPRFAFALGVGLLLIQRAKRLQKLDEFPPHSVVSRQAA